MGDARASADGAADRGVQRADAVTQDTNARPGRARRRPAAIPPEQPSLGLDTAAFAMGLVVISLLFQQYAPEPYMDEIFHIPQTQKYCQGRFTEWDPKITTFPGLYVAGAAAGRLVHYLLSALSGLEKAHEACGTPILRSVNILFGALCFPLLHLLYRRLHPGVSSEYATQMALLIMLLPTNFFFAFLFYTDVGSLALVLASLLAVLDRKIVLSSVLAACAVLFRQTNAVWAAYILMVAVLERLYGRKAARLQSARLAEQAVLTLKLAWKHKWRLLSEMGPLAAVPAAFAGFVVTNRGIVVGDKANHEPQLHLVQPLYLLLFTAASLPHIHFHPSRLSEAFWVATAAFRRKPSAVLKPLGMGFVLAAYAVHHYTLVHPFLLADNRHYTFYVWKDVIAPYPAAKYCLLPLYLFAGWSIRRQLHQGGMPDLWQAGLGICAAATLVPAWLIEPRYFTVPFVLITLHSRPPSRLQLLAGIAGFAALNAATIYVFLLRPFVWPDGTVARFMW